MADKRTTNYENGLSELKEMLTVVVTKQEYELNHLRNIDSHLEKLNSRTGKSEVVIAKHCEQIEDLKDKVKSISEDGTNSAQRNSSSIGWIIKIGGPLIIILIGLIIYMVERFAGM
jgi:dsDNA-specific endonuclease/ATPase MutS2